VKIRGFISYSHEDGTTLASGLAKYLTNLLPNFEAVYDDNVPPGNKIEDIKQNLETCNILILIITPASLRSTPIKDEIELANKRMMKIIPCKDEYLKMEWNHLPFNIKEFIGVEFENMDELKRKTYSALTKVLEQFASELQKSIEKSKTSRSELPPEKIKEMQPKHDKYPWSKFSFDRSDDSFNILASIIKGKINNIFLDKKALSLIVEIQSFDEEGLLKIVFPRKLLDSKSKGNDDQFFVLVDGKETEYEEMPSSKARALFIPLQKGSSEVEIIGTEVMGISYSGETKKENIITIPPNASIASNSEFFVPNSLEIHGGDKVRWENHDSAAHTITSGDIKGEGSDGLFDSSLIAPGASFEVALNKSGTYKYFCMVHPWAEGTIIVSD